MQTVNLLPSYTIHSFYLIFFKKILEENGIDAEVELI